VFVVAQEYYGQLIKKISWRYFGGFFGGKRLLVGAFHCLESAIETLAIPSNYQSLSREISYDDFEIWHRQAGCRNH